MPVSLALLPVERPVDVDLQIQVRPSVRGLLPYRQRQVLASTSMKVATRPRKRAASVRSVGTRTDGTSTGLVDWLGKRASFTPWVAKG